MNPETPLDENGAPLDISRQVDQICLRFEDAWRGGQRPVPAEYVRESPLEIRDMLVRELIAIDLAYRFCSGEQPAASDYAASLAQYARVIEAAFRSLGVSRALRICRQVKQSVVTQSSGS